LVWIVGREKKEWEKFDNFFQFLTEPIWMKNRVETTHSFFITHSCHCFFILLKIETRKILAKISVIVPFLVSFLYRIHLHSLSLLLGRLVGLCGIGGKAWHDSGDVGLSQLFPNSAFQSDSELSPDSVLFLHPRPVSGLLGGHGNFSHNGEFL
jgi:hypothetical protein